MIKITKKTKVILVVISILSILLISGILAYFTDTATVTNHVTMGIVDIKLEEYMYDDKGDKIPWSDQTNVTPGEVISKIPEISCVEGAVDCYVRAKVEITSKDEELGQDSEMLTTDDLDVDQSDWFYCEHDGYFYYKNILTDKDEPIQLFTKVSIPTGLDNKWSLNEFSIDVTAEAIQAQNFEPVFDEGTEEPWPDISEEDIEVCKYPNHTKQD